MCSIQQIQTHKQFGNIPIFIIKLGHPNIFKQKLNYIINLLFIFFQAENPKKTGPRLCALRIPNGSSNILLDNVDETTTPVVYTKRTRFLDEELTDTRDVITTTTGAPTTTPSRICDTKISMVMSDVNPGDNKTDSEKYREVHSKDNSIVVNIPAISQNFLNEINSSKNAKTSTQTSSISSDVDLQESALLRRQQLTRCVEWVQNSSQQIGGIVGTGESSIEKLSKNSSMEALSVDSGYKTKTGILVSENLIINNAQNLNNTKNCNLNLFKVTDKLSDETNFAQINLNNVNNNLLSNESSSNSITHNNNLTKEQKQYLNENGELSCSSSSHVDIAQMEYNVKQFLLKQNEWAIHKSAPIAKNPHRTETNL